jgi:Protein of unknown function (DUF2924)
MPRPSFDRAVIAAEIERIRSQGLDELRSLWHATFRTSSPPGFTKDLIARFLCWHIQEQAFGGLDPKTAKVLAGLAQGDRSQRDRPRRLKSGTALVREYQGERHTVTIVANGFVWREATYASLSTIARAITGTNWNGPRFFGLRTGKETTISPDAADAPPASPSGRTPARTASSRSRRAAGIQRSTGDAVPHTPPLVMGSTDNEAGRSKTPTLRDLYPQIERA